jgi:hypothetical protein
MQHQDANLFYGAANHRAHCAMCDSGLQAELAGVAEPTTLWDRCHSIAQLVDGHAAAPALAQQDLVPAWSHFSKLHVCEQEGLGWGVLLDILVQQQNSGAPQSRK